MKASDYQALHKKPTRAAPQTKSKSGKELLDLTSSEVSNMIDGFLLKVPQYLEYGDNTIVCHHKGYEVTISFKIKKL
ncbi:hypothetical protein FVR03_01215 [Pontibacter qinzhouensis]|uniref:Uncharacterized protein n=1 Tax=Pontibacter qinzhouensis TaxID=2603253 RepID=A0A5C8KFN3_9BACT|nr:hypothetical protein [Pontibacter qinzhouensis]TXK52363.1 hypothetical protein FVR03_01215 [Pontibacter qinzhouensis]